MSGGHFDYGCFRISQFADELQHEIDINDVKDLDEWGDNIGKGYEKETMDRIIAAHAIIEKAGKLAREIEWLYSGDHGEDSFNRLIDEILKE
jgi:hypothetical protein